MTILGMQAMVAASYFLLSSPADDDDLQHRSLAEMAAEHRRDRGDDVFKTYMPEFTGWGEWPTWGPVQNTFRRLCTLDDRSNSYRRSLSLGAVDRIIPNFVARYFSDGDAEKNRLKRFLACNVGKLAGKK